METSRFSSMSSAWFLLAAFLSLFSTAHAGGDAIRPSAGVSVTSILLVMAIVGSVLLTFVFLLLLFLKWRNSGMFAKFTLGCLSLGSMAGAFLFTIIFLFSSLGGGGSGGGDTGAGRQVPVPQIGANVLHEQGAALYSEAVFEADLDKLFDAIGYLEEALAAAPEDRAIMADLADAYVETGHPALTALALEFYESLLESFTDDPLLARMILGYQQLGNYDAALALAEKRLVVCGSGSRMPAALQVSMNSILAGRPDQGLAALSEDIRRRGANNSIELMKAALEQARGDNNAALKVLDAVSKQSDLDPATQNYIARFRRSLSE